MTLVRPPPIADTDAHGTAVAPATTVGLLLWATDERVIPPRLRSAFARGRWLSGVPVLHPDPHGGARGAARTIPRDGWWLDAGLAAAELATVPLSHLVRFSPSIGLWTLAAKWVVEIVLRQQVVPAIVPAAEPGHWRSTWRAAPVRAEDRSRLQELGKAMPGVARGWSPHTTGAPLVWTPVAALQEFADAAADGLMRASNDQAVPTVPERAAPGWAVRLARSLGGPNPSYDLRGVAESHLPDTLGLWVAPAAAVGGTGRPVVGFRLSEPKSPKAPWLLSYHLSPDGRDERIPASELAAPSPGFKEIVKHMVAPEETLLEALGRCARVFEPIGRSLSQKLPVSVSVSAAEAWDFITSKSLQLERAGYVVEVPAALSRVGRRRVRARMRIGVDAGKDAAPPPGAHGRTGLLAGVVNYRWEACLGEDRLTEAEFLELVKAKAPLVHHRGQWIAVDPADVARLQALMGEGKGQLDAAEALRLALVGEVQVPESPDAKAEVAVEGHVAQALAQLRQGIAEGPRDLPTPERLHAELRPYQRRGFAWLFAITELGFGACLADDMGLGKTVQLLAMFAQLVSEQQKAATADLPAPACRFLVVCPTSVLGNWRREIRRFYPDLHVVIHHGPTRSQTVGELADRMKPYGAGTQPLPPAVVLTSYALGRRDREMLSQMLFDCVVLDEAQNIKNPEAAQSQAVRHLYAKRRVALTGTPVENRLTELWSIVDFLNPRLLGGQSAFKRQFAVPIERYGDEQAADLLKKITAPFILRRMKSDPAIAPELPEKAESTRYCPLTREQAALYQTTVDKALEDIVGTELSMERRGRILAMLTAIKQICNHPGHFLKDGGVSPARSGKLTRVLQLLDEVLENEGAALVFTQFTEMGHILERVLSDRLGRPIPFLYGALSRQQRDEMVQSFQSPDGPPVLIVSLRAGGTGLNLTRANHVFHYDRWWNPAVEDQATDRAFRIGQTRDVTVHRLVSQGTLEEQIHQLLEDKRHLADRVVGAGETWLSELDDDTLRSLIALGQDAVLDDGSEA
ncbi:MAG: DEAD/DEAH box helicase [Myxococcota bacterium]